MSKFPQALSISAIKDAYHNGDFSPEELLEEVLKRCKKHSDNPIWIHQLDDENIKAYLLKLKDKSPEELPLYGIPFAIKDNIDLAGIPTTAACEDYTYIPDQSAFVVQRLLDAGAIPVGKTNLDQFATGLNGTRSPWGAVQNSFNKDYISGGSSSGSSVAVALGLVSFSLGTDTAGSGRVPAAFNNLIGLKPTRGLLSTSGVVPACRTLDCVTVFSLTPEDALTVLSVAEHIDSNDAYSRSGHTQRKPVSHEFRVGVPHADQLQFFGDDDAEALYNNMLVQIMAAGGELVEVDFTPFRDAANLLYQGPWIAERFAAIEDFIGENAGSLLPEIRAIIEPATHFTAVDTFKSIYQLQAYKQLADEIVNSVDFIVTPTAGTIYSIEAMQSDPITLNNNLGYYTNFMNLLDYSALAIPGGFTSKGLPWGVTLFSNAFRDRVLLGYGNRILAQGECKLGASDEGAKYPAINIDDSNAIDIVVCGAHMSGMALNDQLTERQAVLVRKTLTASNYRFYALAGGPPYRPGLVRDNINGAAIEVEIWRMPSSHFGSFMKLIPHPLGVGTVELENGQWCNSFICEPCGLEGATDITDLGSWRVFIADLD